jgi:hypothetical protein
MISIDGQSDWGVISREDVQKGFIELKLTTKGGQINITSANLREIRSINPRAIFVIRAGSATMSIPISELDQKAYGRQYGIPEDSVRFGLIIREPDPAVNQANRQSAEAIQARLLTAPMVFEVQVTGGNKQSVFMSSFNRYVARTLPLNSDSVPETATGVWWVPGSKEFKFVPTSFERIDGRWSAVMKRQGASIYTVIDRPVTFRDLNNHWSSKDAELLASKLLVQGRGEQAFDPNATITRAEIAALLVRALGLTEVDGQSPFTDVTGGWYGPAVGTAYRAGLISGYQDGTFRPTSKITREEMVAMMIRAMDYTEVKPTDDLSAYRKYTDESAISGWAADDVKVAQGIGLIDGDGKFRPLSYSSRAEAVTMLKRMLKYIEFI